MKLFLKKYGFYMIVTLCVIGVAAGSYYAVDSIVGGLSDKPQPEVDQPTIVDDEPPVSVVKPEVTEPTVREDTTPAASIIEPKQPQYVVPASGAILAEFSGDVLVKNVTLGDWRTHNGMDFAAVEGDRAVAVYGGKVVYAGVDDLWGFRVELLLDTGYTVIYSGLSQELSVKAGDRVEQGGVIGAIGDGTIIEASLGRHLHFEVIKDQKYIDPASLLAG